MIASKIYPTSIQSFDQIAKRIRILHGRFFEARSAFYIYRGFKKLASPPHAGKKKILLNVNVFNRYKHFFIVSREASRYYFFSLLAKFFDTHRGTVSIESAIKMIRKNLRHLTAANFFEYRRSINAPVAVMGRQYEPPTKKDLDRIQASLRSIQPIVGKLKKYRNQWLAHDASDQELVAITGAELEKTFRVVERVLNKLSGKIEWTTSDYRGISNECEGDMKRIVRDLINYEKKKLPL